jgi:SPP1 gp7 family putative phage head morphogenesis protein|nr:MAG TPA: minor capsid protein [Caudoviricetes sp.]
MRPDKGYDLTEKELKALEKQIYESYKEAYDGLVDIIKEYFAKFADRDASEKARLDAGDITEEQYKQWRLAQIGRGKRFEALRDKVAERMTNANAAAVAYVNDATPGIYSLNRNFAAYTIEQVTGDVGFDLWDEQTVKRLIVEQPELMPYYPPKRALKRGIDLAWGKKQITASVTSSILQGKSIKHMADDLQSRIVTMNRDSAIRTARTAVTGAQNAGRMDSYFAAEKMGIKCRKEWMATLDGRTRHSHAMLDGEVVDNDKKFSNGCRFPGDPQGRPEEIYNCRCTLVSAIEGIDTSRGQRRARNPETGQNDLIENMTYAEWAGWKKRVKKPNFAPAGTIDEAEKYAEMFVESYKSKYTGKVDYRGIDIAHANEMNRALTEVLGEYEVDYKLRNITPFNTREKRFKDTTAEAAYQWGTGDLFFNKKYLKNAKAMAAHIKEYTDLLNQVLPNIDVAMEQTKKKTGIAAELQMRYLKALKKTGRTNVSKPDAYGSMVHELGHYLDDRLFTKAVKESGFDIASSFSKYAENVSAYATSNRQEYVAESFTAYWFGETSELDPELVKIFERLKKK